MKNLRIVPAIIIVCALTVAAVSAAWNIETIDDSGDVGKYVDLELDDEDTPRVGAYAADSHQLIYAYREDDGYWIRQKSSFTNNVVGYVSMDLDSSRNPHFSFTYGNTGSQELRYTYYNGSWAAPENPFTPGVKAPVKDTSITVDPDGHIHITCHHDDVAMGPVYAQKTNLWRSGWYDAAIQSIGEGDACCYGNGTIFVSYRVNSSTSSHIKCRYHNSADTDTSVGSWADVDIGDDPDTDSNAKGPLTAISVYQDLPHVLFLEGNMLYYAYYDGSAWNTEQVADTGGLCSFSIDTPAFNQPHIAFYALENSNRKLKYAYKDSDGWHFEDVDGSSGDTGIYNSIKVDSSGNVHIAYYNAADGDLMYAYRTDQEAITDLEQEKEIRIGDNLFDPSQGGSCRIMYELSKPQPVTIKIYDLTGHLIKTLIDKEEKVEGAHGEDIWYGVNAVGEMVSTGIYYVVVEGSGWKESGKVAIQRGDHR